MLELYIGEDLDKFYGWIKFMGVGAKFFVKKFSKMHEIREETRVQYIEVGKIFYSVNLEICEDKIRRSLYPIDMAMQ